MRAIALIATLATLGASALVAGDAYPVLHNPDNRRPMLGIEMTPVPLNVQEQQALAPNQGVYVQSIFNGTAAQSMGLRPGDVVLAVNGAPIGSMTDLRNEVSLNQVGDPVEVTVQRQGTQTTTTGQFQPWPSNIPYEPIDPAMEQRFRDWQERRLARTRDEVEDLKRQVADMAKGLDPDNKAADALGITDPALAASDAMGLAWRFRYRVAAPADLTPVAAPAPTVASDPAARTWHFAWAVDSAKPAQEPL
jgi:membrane-associated protease RseP (regulator of RpoE activity)